ncbi:hypothetical protein H5410_038669 [Solanum commersonii]|uniref:Transmembrane protein n=1 Tax=Solanum commersonii TaxID=4109 RepID=A0A9J5YBC9_SOLCO|nr:hypothetical protein H5410_038669 [Solanum commersonii]
MVAQRLSGSELMMIAGMIFMSVLVISTVIFTCGDPSNSRKEDDGGGSGGGGCGGACGGLIVD